MNEFKGGSMIQLKSCREKMTISQICYPHNDKIGYGLSSNENFYSDILVKIYGISND